MELKLPMDVTARDVRGGQRYVGVSAYRSPESMDLTARDVRAGQMYVAVSAYRSSEPPAPSPRIQRRVARPSEKSWWSDPEAKRMRRVAGYKLYGAEGRFKASVRNGFCRLKRHCAWVR